MVMIFTLVSAAQEWLNVRWEDFRNKREEHLAQKLEEEEEAERVKINLRNYVQKNILYYFFQKRFEGTRVTVETFMNWKTQFEDDTGITKKKETIEKEGKKLTGRELFITDKTLNESDLKFLEDGADTVKVDESLFQDLDDLDLDDEDESFGPNNFSDDASS